MSDSAQQLTDRITEYLAHGGFFNPEHMEHDKVRNLLIDCREFFRQQLHTTVTHERKPSPQYTDSPADCECCICALKRSRCTAPVNCSPAST